MHTPDQQQLVHLADLAVQAARKGGSILMGRYGKPHDITNKGLINLVTEADLASEQAITTFLRSQTPEIAIMSEEQADSHGLEANQILWVLDPLDGTTSFAHGFPYFAVSIALLQDGQPLLGVVYAPFQDELFVAIRGQGATLNGQAIRVSGIDQPVAALVATGFPYERQDCLEAVVQRLGRVLGLVRDLRRGGAAALDLSYVACGRLDAFYEIQLKPWDSAAGWLLVLEAGGMVTGMDGAPYSPFIPHLLASNGRLHKALQPLMLL